MAERAAIHQTSVCVHALLFYALALAEEPLLRELNGAKRLVQTDRRSMFSV